MRPYSSCRAQGVIEYLLIVTAVIVVLVVSVLHKGGVFVKGTNSVLSFAGDRIDKNRSQINFKTTP